MIKQMSIQLNEESQRQLAWLSRMGIAGGKATAIQRQSLAEFYHRQRNVPRCFYLTGSNGTLLELSDGRHADTVAGVTSEDMTADDALIYLLDQAHGWDASPVPLLADLSLEELERHVGQ